MNKLLFSTIFLFSIPNLVFADSVSSTLQANAQLSPSCTISAQNVDFSFSPTTTATALRKNSSVIMTCSNALSYTMNVSSGSSGLVSDRTMTSSNGDILHYNFYSNAAANPPNYANNYAVIGTGSSMTYTLFGKLFTNQFVSPGTYSDSLTVTLNY